MSQTAMAAKSEMVEVSISPRLCADYSINTTRLSRTDHDHHLYVVFHTFSFFIASKSSPHRRIYTRLRRDSSARVSKSTRGPLRIIHSSFHPKFHSSYIYFTSISYIITCSFCRANSHRSSPYTSPLFDRLVQSYHSLAATYFVDIQYSLSSLIF